MRLLILLLLGVLTLFQYDFWFGKNGYLDYKETEQEISQHKAENAKLSQRNQVVAAEIKDLKEIKEILSKELEQKLKEMEQKNEN